jgi:hypothetical protein
MLNHRWVLSSAILLLLTVLIGFSQTLGPKAVLPDFRLPDQNGAIRDFQSIRGPRGAMLVFYRSADW